MKNWLKMLLVLVLVVPCFILVTACSRGDNSGNGTNNTDPGNTTVVTVMAEGEYALSGIKLSIAGLKAEMSVAQFIGYIGGILAAADCEECEEPEECECENSIDGIMTMLEMTSFGVEGNNVVVLGKEIAYTLNNGVVTLDIDWEEIIVGCEECDGCAEDGVCEGIALMEEALENTSIRYAGNTVTITDLDSWLLFVLFTFVSADRNFTSGGSSEEGGSGGKVVVGEGSSFDAAGSFFGLMLALLEDIEITVVFSKVA